jgi:hypothetical protein
MAFDTTLLFSTYTTLLHPSAWSKAELYLESLRNGRVPGYHLQQALQGIDPNSLATAAFIDLLVNTKQPQIFAESAIAGDGSDWTLQELSILGDISIAVPVSVYDDGLHHSPQVHHQPFKATLLYTPGALLRNDSGPLPADWEELTVGSSVDAQAFKALYERRLLPALIHANQVADSVNRKAFVTIPGLGCGQFAGPFAGQLGEFLREALAQLLHRHHPLLTNIKAVYFDPYSECDNNRHSIGHIEYLVRPLAKGNTSKPQLCPPRQYEEPGDDFSDCDLFSFVAWDHVSWPGNDFYGGHRATDDGVKAAATDSMAQLTGFEGHYQVASNRYLPPEEYETWEDVVLANGLKLRAAQTMQVLPVPSTEQTLVLHR